MKRLYVTVEGQTEAAFATSVLTPHLANFGVFLRPPRFTGLHKRRRGRIPQGGMRNTFGHALADRRTRLAEDRSADGDGNAPSTRMLVDGTGSLEGAIDNPFRIGLWRGREPWVSTCGGYPGLG
jgi:hypothetical protein